MSDLPRSPGLRMLHDRYVGDDPARVASFERTLSSMSIAGEIERVRTEAGLSQAKLGEMIGVGKSQVSRLEDQGYGGHTMTTLRKIAAALGVGLEVRFVEPVKGPSEAKP